MLSAFEKGTKKLIFASKGVSAICPDCEKELIPKCGKTQRVRYKKKMIKATINCKLLHGNNDIKDEVYQLFNFYNNYGFKFDPMFDRFN